jgi:acyl carrier protein
VGTDVGNVRTIIMQLLDRLQKSFDGELTDDVLLYGDGLGLDSLEAAELSALLEDEYGSDPFSAGGAMPETVGDIVSFYEVAGSA